MRVFSFLGLLLLSTLLLVSFLVGLDRALKNYSSRHVWMLPIGMAIGATLAAILMEIISPPAWAAYISGGLLITAAVAYCVWGILRENYGRDPS